MGLPVSRSTPPSSHRVVDPATVVVALAVAAAAAWAYWPTLTDMADRWQSDPQYSHGFLVPLFSTYLLWVRRHKLAGPARGRWFGVALVAVASAVRVAAGAAFVNWFDAGSLLIALAGVAVAARGWVGLRWAWPAILFLGFMAPLPYAAHTALSGSLQRTATKASTYLLVATGVPAVAEGNRILLSNDTPVQVADACSGLGMMMTCAAMGAALAIVLRSDRWWVRAAVALAAVPVAVAVNILRITATGLLYDRSADEWARWVFHDVAGWLMMPAAAALFLMVLWTARRVVVPDVRR